MKKAILTFLLPSLFAFVAAAPAAEKNVFVYPFPFTDHIDGEPFPEIAVQAAKQLVEEKILEKSKLLETQLKKKIFGQDEAVEETANAIVRFAAGVNDPAGPIASLLYCGPSGVGKTELARQLCLELFGDTNHFIRINMSEYIEPHSISRLIGAPPGYIGYDSGGGLSNRLIENPYSVVLLDEIEKAHPQILKLFMHVFDAGYFTSARGEDVNCRKAIFILTSNLASCEIADMHGIGMRNKEILEVLKPQLMDALSPELFNRLDCMVFAPLSDAIYELLIRKLLGELQRRVAYFKSIDIIFEQSVVDYLKTYNLDPNLGARPLKRTIEKELATVIAKSLIDQAIKPGDYVNCSYFEGNIILSVLLTEDPS
jgi:ATP-dependent Clp protease ATP-binding subunit ClpB